MQQKPSIQLIHHVIHPLKLIVLHMEQLMKSKRMDVQNKGGILDIKLMPTSTQNQQKYSLLGRVRTGGNGGEEMGEQNNRLSK